MALSSTVTEALCIVGEPRSGKTSALIERAAAWVQAGPSAPDGPSPFLFFCASPVTVETAAERLSQRGLACTPADPTTPLSCQHGERAGTATTPFHYACRILADPVAQKVTGRSGRVLDRAEEAVFYEDLKTCGLKRRRLRELWAFLQCGLANLDDGDPAWIQTTEERAVLDRARDILVFENAILPGEAVNLAVRALEAEPVLRQRFGAPVVLADDYLLMSRASQRLATLLATDKIAVAGSEGAVPAAFEPYPCTTGFAELAEAHAPVQRVTLEASFRTVKRTWETAPDLPGEMGLIARTIAEELAGGTSPDAIAVVGVNRTWRANLKRALSTVGISASSLRRQVLKAPQRELAPADDAERERVLKQLCRSIPQPADRPDPLLGGAPGDTEPPGKSATFPSAGDSIAWRQWLSFDDVLGRSAAVLELRRVAQPQGLNLAEALAALNADALDGLPATSPFALSLLGPYRTALQRLEEQDQSTTVKETATEAPDVALAPASDTFLTSRANQPGGDFSTKESEPEGDIPAIPASATSTPAVVIAAPEDLFGRTFAVVIFGGFVNGFIPSRDMCDPGVVVGGARARQEAADRAAIALAEQRATRRLLFTSFQSCDLETAERLRLSIPRIRLRGGVRVCDIHPSNYLCELDLC